jgi:hypothetical protein
VIVQKEYVMEPTTLTSNLKVEEVDSSGTFVTMYKTSFLVRLVQQEHYFLFVHNKLSLCLRLTDAHSKSGVPFVALFRTSA